MNEQHDDHIWLRAGGEPWAIMAIQRREDRIIFYLWRGYYPILEYNVMELVNPDWEAYCEVAVRMLREYWG
jgi:hypothetical protein